MIVNLWNWHGFESKQFVVKLLSSCSSPFRDAVHTTLKRLHHRSQTHSALKPLAEFLLKKPMPDSNRFVNTTRPWIGRRLKCLPQCAWLLNLRAVCTRVCESMVVLPFPFPQKAEMVGWLKDMYYFHDGVLAEEPFKPKDNIFKPEKTSPRRGTL